MPMSGTDFRGLRIQFEGKSLYAQVPRLIEKCPFTTADIEHGLCGFTPAELEGESKLRPVAHIVISLFQFLVELPGTGEGRIEKAKAAGTAFELDYLALGRECSIGRVAQVAPALLP